MHGAISGIPPMRSSRKMHVTQLRCRSFGFVSVECSRITDTPVGIAVRSLVVGIGRFGNVNVDILPLFPPPAVCRASVVVSVLYLLLLAYPCDSVRRYASACETCLFCSIFTCKKLNGIGALEYDSRLYRLRILFSVASRKYSDA